MTSPSLWEKESKCLAKKNNAFDNTFQRIFRDYHTLAGEIALTKSLYRFEILNKIKQLKISLPGCCIGLSEWWGVVLTASTANFIMKPPSLWD